ncbi:TetR/AcrR family transcriptional regulator [Nocardioides perillae]|uniref:AcrR family transcriptional regulator n=1 Tax=Nocardioides perillae TaxID=1119534 RepID=A0A7Y9RXP3_9ACTN|nr:AcrR family transcriptional regulator [Nocardioides perillae]
MTPEAPQPRPRVEGDREQEVLDAALDVLVEVGYDRLTMDAVATRARASKATLYRRWAGKAALVTDALAAARGPLVTSDTGTLRGDLLAAFCGPGGFTEPSHVRHLASVATAIATDPEFAAAFRERVVAAKLLALRGVFERAAARGELRDDADLDVLAPTLPALLVHRCHVLGELPDDALVERVVDQVVLPAALRPAHPDRRPDRRTHS